VTHQPDGDEPTGDVDPKRRYDAMVWQADPTIPGRRVSVVATSLDEALAKLEAEHGEGTVFDLRNEDDAEQIR